MKRISRYVIIVLAVLSSLIVFLTVYGSETGNFIITVSKDTYFSISLCESSDFGVNNSNGTTVLHAPGITNASCTTLGFLPKDIDDSKYQGSHGDPDGSSYIAYSFYLKNTSTKGYSIAYTTDIRITQCYKNVDKAIRIMVIKDGSPTIFAAPRILPDGSVEPWFSDGEDDFGMNIQGYQTVSFIDDTLVCNITENVLDSEETSRYTVVVWLEGGDIDCTDDILGGSIRMTMNFAVSGT